MPKCRFCNDEAIGEFFLSGGCLVYPNDRYQNLCWHHVLRATNLGGFELVKDYTLPGGLRLTDIIKQTVEDLITAMSIDEQDERLLE